MPHEDVSKKRTSKKRKNGKKETQQQNKKEDPKEKNSERVSATSSSTHTTPKQVKNVQPKVQILKRNSEDSPVTPSPPSQPVQNRLPSLMDVEVGPKYRAQGSSTMVTKSTISAQPLMERVMKPTYQTTPTNHWNIDTAPVENMNLSMRHASANKKQRNSYYFSDNAGTAVSKTEFQDSVQYYRNDYPLDKNEDILIEKKFNLMITPTSGRCKALFIRVKSQNNDSTNSTGALLKVDANDEEVRKACEEAIENFIIVNLPHDRYPFSEVSESFLSTCFIRRLEERQDSFPEAIYYCEKCDYHINTMGHARSHLESSTHFDDVDRQLQRQKMLEKIPEPNKEHLIAVERVLRNELDSYQSVKKEGAECAEKILHYLREDLFQKIGYPDVQLKPFGSATYDVVLPDSDYNVAFTTVLPEETHLFTFLEKIRMQIIEDGYHADHLMDMGTSSTIIFTFESTRVRLCWLSTFHHRGQLHFSQLMKVYTSLRPEVVEFLQLIRLWATKSQVDSKNGPRIGLPRYGFDLLAIHFLQQEGLLPVLHELYTKDSEEKLANGEERENRIEKEDKEQPSALEKDHGDDGSSPRNQPEEARQRRVRLASRYLKNKEQIFAAFSNLKNKPWDLASIWIRFFRYYVKHNRDVVVQITQLAPMSRDCNKWNKKILHVMDPFRSDNVLSIPKVSTWQPYYFNCLLATYLSFACPRNKKGALIEWSLVQMKSANSKKRKEPEPVTPKRPNPVLETPKSNQTMPQITEEEFNQAADLLAEETEHEHYVQELMSRLSFDGIKVNDLKGDDVEIDEHKNQIYSRRTMMRVHRVHRGETNWDILQELADYELLEKKVSKKSIKRNKKELAVRVPQSNEVIVDSTSEPSTPQDKVPILTVMLARTRIVETGTEKDTEKGSENNPETPTTILTPKSETTDEPKLTAATFAVRNNFRDMTREKRICTEEFFIKDCYIPNDAELKRRVDIMKAEDYCYQFTPDSFSAGYEMEMKCTHCDGSHCVEECPMMEIPPIEKFPPRSPDVLKVIDDIIDKYYKDNVLEETRIAMLQDKVKELERYLRTNYREDVNLEIFGSVMTGLSGNCSDIDICLRFEDRNNPPKGLTPKEVIQATEERLRKCWLTKNVQAITTAKVPIVKFQMTLADSKVIDVDISYYNILALYNTDLLREYTHWTPDKRFAKLALFIKGWAKFCDIGDASRGSLSSYAHIILLVSYLQQCDPPVLPRLQEDFRSGNTDKRIIDNWDTGFAVAEEALLKEWPKNKESCAQLLIGYLDYYSRFDFRNFVVQCRREMTLCKMEKEWPKPLCVEDPFDLNHNLSSGVTKKMFVFVMKVFIASRAVFMSLIPNCPRDANFLDNFRSQLFAACSQGTAPTDRQCHSCHRIGHYYESCPQSLYRKERKRFGSNSTNSSYRSGGNKQNVGGLNGEKLVFHKRPYNRRFNR